MLEEIKQGTLVVIKAYSPTKGLYLKAVGVCLSNEIITDPELGKGKQVKWCWSGNKCLGRFQDAYTNIRMGSLYIERNEEILDEVLRLFLRKKLTEEAVVDTLRKISNLKEAGEACRKALDSFYDPADVEKLLFSYLPKDDFAKEELKDFIKKHNKSSTYCFVCEELGISTFKAESEEELLVKILELKNSL
jgi:hypothetical protein